MRVLITGASGSGTSTLACELASTLSARVFQADDYFWLPTSPPFTSKRDPNERLAMFLRDLAPARTSVIGGSIVDWGLELPGRSRQKHERWLAERNVPILRIDGDVSLEHVRSTVLAALKKLA